MSILNVTALRKSWGDNRIVDDISFETREGEFISLLGPSGCGKSTTLRLIAGLETAEGGRITLGGRDITTLPPSQRGISMVFQSYALFPHLTVGQNITFGLSVRGQPRRAQAAKLAEVAPLLGLEKLLDRRPAQLSGGQQQRVALGRALVSGAPVCLLDEPLSNLDAKLRSEMRAEIRALQQRLGITMIFVTHDQTEAMSMSDRVALLRDGRIEQIGAPEELYSRPASTFVAEFIGAPPMNILMPEMLGVRGADLPRDLLIGLRPEDIELVDHGLPGMVRSVEFLGADSILSVDIDAMEFGGARLVVRVAGRPAFGPGKALCLRWPVAAEHYFDARTGARRNANSVGPGTVQSASVQGSYQ